MKARNLLVVEGQSAGFDDVDVRKLEQVGIHDIDDVRMRVHGQAGQAMDAAHELAIRAGIVGRPAPTLRREEVASAEFRTVIRRGLGHGAAEEAAVAKSAFAISQPREVELRIVRIGSRRLQVAQ